MSVQPSTALASQRRRAAFLSALAAAFMVLIFFLSFAVWNDATRVRVWLVVIATPAIAVSVAAWYQYRYARHSGGGAAAAVLLWVFVLLFGFRAAAAFVPAAVLQTVAWYIGRPR